MSNLALNLGHELVVVNFAGAGGADEGIRQALGRDIDLAINHDPVAIAVHKQNHPNTEHAVADVWDIDPEQATNGQPVGLAWFSPDCRHHSKAKGGRPVSKSVRGLAWVAARWAARVKPRVIMLENVEEFRDWGPLMKDAQGRCVPDPVRKGQTYRAFIRVLKRNGYTVEDRILRACDYGAPTIRKRLFLIARRDGLPIKWPEPTHGEGRLPYRPASDCIDWSIPATSIFERKKPLAENTLRRIAAGVMRYVVKSGQPFIVKCNHTARAGYYNAFRGQSIDDPLQTVTQSPGFALVSAFLAKHYTGVVGASLDAPAPTMTTVDHNALVSCHMLNMKGTSRSARDMRDPVTTVCAGGTHASLVSALLAPYYGSGSGETGRDITKPAPTVTTKDRLQLVTVKIDGETYVITDIGMRMLQPHELAAAQGFPESYSFDRIGDRPLSKAHQVRLIGNSVCPPLAKALVEANFGHEHQFMEVLAA
ncbi:DNA cytosine methyltransferase [Carnimonas bestiolae]|uniref:DNA cytosine methyltransferase n=1 Tax=Carnimonas bestiolae TaxID=3402172 RepID=UPI003EDB9D37